MIRPTAVRSLARSAPAYSGAFRPSHRVSARKPEFQPHFGGITPGVVMSWVPSLALWGGAAGGAVLLFMSKVPIFQHDVLDKIPFVKTFYVDDTPDSDKPF
ncbi:hypothetical protein BCV69DRAFT_299109 [Microstroma glucosiphilum]|uniref:Uncharacterized protein n=1 Tax=Pseudomicrostroma glucosiphilum TaxID=1684307 RepID=A0A316U728_9BASI|nr:hypothetical protein BCV69DRAFT_299109 [Pseudomicrostroma glucosiphilum]PWN20628.1 hypothetical protein BCV69DRAFT_299109 [Pseudomicrostroma glucosiphilum]